MKRLIGFLLTLAILLCMLPGTCWAQEQQTEETYIVKYKDPPDDKPFQIVSAQELKVLLEQQALEWYEPDEEIPLDDPTDVRFPVRTATHSWALELIHAGSALQSGYTGQGIRDRPSSLSGASRILPSGSYSRQLFEPLLIKVFLCSLVDRNVALMGGKELLRVRQDSSIGKGEKYP